MFLMCGLGKCCRLVNDDGWYEIFCVVYCGGNGVVVKWCGFGCVLFVLLYYVV